MRNAFGLLALLILSGLAVSPAAARDIFVNNVAGDDGATGRFEQPNGERTGPVRSIAKALRLAERSDRIVLAKTDQPYRESISLVGRRHSGHAWQPFIIEGKGAILDGSTPVPGDAWEHYRGAVFRFRPPGLRFQQLFLAGKPVQRVRATPRGAPPPHFEPLQWCLDGQHLYFCVEQDKLPEDYDLSFAALRAGVTFYHVEHVALVDLTVQGFHLDGINAFNTARDVRLVGVTSRGNGRSGVAVGAASRATLEGCLVGDNGTAQLLTLPYSRTRVRDSTLIGNTAPAWVDRGGQLLLDGEVVEGGRDEIAPKPEAKPQPK